MVDDGRYRLLSRPRFIVSARINRNGWDSEIPTAFRIGPKPSTTGPTPSPSESRDSERLDSSRCLARALASQVMATHARLREIRDYLEAAQVAADNPREPMVSSPMTVEAIRKVLAARPVRSVDGPAVPARSASLLARACSPVACG
jgi:hypothetical protein